MHPFICVDDTRFGFIILLSVYARIVWVFKRRSEKLYAVKLFYIYLYVAFYVIDDYKLIINKMLQSIVKVLIADKYFHATYDIHDCLHRNLLV